MKSFKRYLVETLDVEFSQSCKLDPSDPDYDECLITITYEGVKIGSMRLEYDGINSPYPEWARTADVYIADEFRRAKTGNIFNYRVGLQTYDYCLKLVQSWGFKGLYSQRRYQNKYSNNLWETYHTEKVGEDYYMTKLEY